MKKIIILGVLLLLTGCGNDSDNDELWQKYEESKDCVLRLYTEQEIQEEKLDANYLKTDLSDISIMNTNAFSSSELRSPTGVLCRENDVIICDMQRDCLLVFDYQGNLLKTIGNTGNGELEFMCPMALDSFESNIYILDGRNNRVQVLNSNFEYIESVSINKYDADSNFFYSDMVVGNSGEIYISGQSLDESYIFCYDKGNSTPIRIGNNFCGSLAKGNGHIYAINIGSLYITEDEKDGIGLTNGRNYLFEVKDMKIEKICELPYGLYIRDFIIEDEKIICTSASLSQLLVFDLKGNIIKSLGKINEERVLYYSCVASTDDSRFIVTDSYNNEICVTGK